MLIVHTTEDFLFSKLPKELVQYVVNCMMMLRGFVFMCSVTLCSCLGKAFVWCCFCCDILKGYFCSDENVVFLLLFLYR